MEMKQNISHPRKKRGFSNEKGGLWYLKETPDRKHELFTSCEQVLLETL
jgi:hypothetical protein